MPKTAAVFLLVFLAGGCAQNSSPVALAPDPAPVTTPTPAPAAAPVAPKPVVIDLSYYQILVPVGAISRSATFWSRVEEPVIDPSQGKDTGEANDLLNENGLRIGRGAVQDWPKFKKILDAAGANTFESHFLAPAATDEEIAMSGVLPDETLFSFDSHGLSGRVYDQCQNLMALSFAPAPGQADVVRLELCPLVRSVRRHYSYSVLNQPDTVEYTSDEQAYDLDLRVDLPPGKFLIVAPSPQAERPTSIGRQFLSRQAKTGERELIMIFAVNGRPAAITPASGARTDVANGPAAAAGGRAP
jgi:hypothetical protein